MNYDVILIIFVLLRSSLGGTANPNLVDELNGLNYSKWEIPSKQLVNFTVQFGIYSIRDVDTKSLTYKLTAAIRLKWQDENLASLNQSFRQDIGEDKLVWVPTFSLIYAVAPAQRLHGYFQQHEGYLSIRPRGRISYSDRDQYMLQCGMFLHSFPFDTQICRFTIGFAY